MLKRCYFPQIFEIVLLEEPIMVYFYKEGNYKRLGKLTPEEGQGHYLEHKQTSREGQGH